MSICPVVVDQVGHDVLAVNRHIAEEREVIESIALALNRCRINAFILGKLMQHARGGIANAICKIIAHIT